MHWTPGHGFSQNSFHIVTVSVFAVWVNHKEPARGTWRWWMMILKNQTTSFHSWKNMCGLVVDDLWSAPPVPEGQRPGRRRLRGVKLLPKDVKRINFHRVPNVSRQDLDRSSFLPHLCAKVCADLISVEWNYVLARDKSFSLSFPLSAQRGCLQRRRQQQQLQTSIFRAKQIVIVTQGVSAQAQSFFVVLNSCCIFFYWGKFFLLFLSGSGPPSK